ncbi:nucleotide-diphospho-sugar transferase [Eremomyces bilateralis CBS 781.70]|uniref:glycogenin glucosyltransferase n=1 Tax=Eremomyces bilateralis CBS 781.70 TaxID=1392243 RepID=A0A6G1GD91_9PEZI|nr:nucleotide-diphospho-sugar transferase [Eremomyces bilateralis CBS 781.70]KAF1816067.1 nucleotide-diphospho-sugar transferase [Eremomyces bilateralis CBS 781.70]
MQLVMSDSYLPGAAVLAHSLRDAGTTKKLACLITLDTLAADTISKLDSLYDYLIPVERTANPTPSNLYLMGRPDLLFTFTKIALWRQTRFRKIVYIDADVVALRAPDELFDIDAPFAAAPDIGWPDAFNTGVMVISPNMGEYWALHTMASSGDSFDGADQGLLNQYYEHKKWHRLSFTYNCTPNAEYQWEPAYRHYKSHISMVHFIGKNKPWTKARNQGSGVYSELLARWWAVHDRHLKESASELVVQTQTSAAQPPIARPPTAQPHVEKEVEQKVEQEVEKGDRSTGFEHPALGYTDHIPTTVVRAAPTTTPETPATEVPMTEPGEPAENIEQGVTQPTPTVEQRRFSAPHAEWDATRNAPPPESKPEAANFPNQVYTFSDEQSLFQPPSSYPEPPKDMWYQVPESKPKTQEKPKPIFPWEMGRETPKPTRVFLDDLPTPPQPEPESDLAPSFSYEKFGREPSPTHEPTEPDEYSTQPFAPTANAWDSVAGIDRYVRAVMEAQARRGIKSPSTAPAPGAIEELLSPIAQQSDPTRRESLILTDFPSAIERPSLPVTPAPIRRPMFWGEERDAAGELPMAEGVPDQAEWVCPRCGFGTRDPRRFMSESVRRAFDDAYAASESVTAVVSSPSSPPPPVQPAQPQLSSSPAPPLPSVQHPRAFNVASSPRPSRPGWRQFEMGTVGRSDPGWNIPPPLPRHLQYRQRPGVVPGVPSTTTVVEPATTVCG